MRRLRECAGWEDLSGALAAAKELAALQSDAVVPAFVAALVALDHVDLTDDAGDVGDEVWRTRQALAYGLEACERRAQPALRALIANEPSRAGEVALLALAKLADPEAAQVAARWVARGVEGAMLPLGLLRPPGAARVLAGAIAAADAPNAGWRKRLAAQALGRIGDDDALAALEVLLDDADWFARLGAVEGLLLIGGPRVAAALARARADTDARVVRAACQPSAL